MEQQTNYYVLWYQAKNVMRVYQKAEDEWQLMKFYGAMDFDFADYTATEFWEQWKWETGYRPGKYAVDIAILYPQTQMLVALESLTAAAKEQGILPQQKWQLTQIKAFLQEKQQTVHQFQYGSDGAVEIQLSDGKLLYARRLDGKAFAADNSIQVQPKQVTAGAQPFSVADLQRVWQLKRSRQRRRTAPPERSDD